MQLHEQYRPTTWGGVVGQDEAVKRFRTIAKRGVGGRAFWIAGPSGTGKTTIARLIAAEIADPFNRIELSVRHEDQVREFRPALGVAVGLGLRRRDEA